MSLVTLHLVILTLTAAVIVYSDHQGFLYLLGKKKLLEQKKIVLLHRLVWVGLIGMIISGGLLLIPSGLALLSYPPFIIKMCMVLALIGNAFFIGRVSHIASTTPFAELTHKEKMKFLISGAISATGWLGAAYIGYFAI